MSFLGTLGTGVGFIGSIVPGVGAGFAVAGAGLTMLAGAPDALTLNPFAEGVFEPGHALWGIPQNDYELAGRDWMIKGRNQPLNPAANEGEGARELAACQAEARRRGAVERVVGHKVWVPGGYQLDGYLIEVTSAAANDHTGTVLKIPVYNHLVQLYQARVDAHGNADPVFPYVDERGWDSYAADSWMDAGAPTMGTHGKSVAQLIAMWRDGTISQAGWKKKRNDAYAQFVTDDIDQKAAYQAEAQHWRDFRAGIQQAALERDQSAQLEQAIHDYYQNAADKDQAAQAIANGEVHFSLGIDPGPSAAVASGAFGLPSPQPQDDTGKLILFGAVALGLLLVIGASK